MPAEAEKSDWIFAGTLQEIQQERATVIKGGIAVFHHEDQVYAVDNRCPHLGFPLHVGSLCDGILTCHWHHARFDVCSGGTFDPWADDVPSHEVRIEEDDVWVHSRSRTVRDSDKQLDRLKSGLEQNIGIVIAKAIVGLLESGVPAVEIARIGIEHGTRLSGGWNSGLTILTAMTRVLPKLDKMGKLLALYQGLHHAARSSSGRAERPLLGQLPSGEVSQERLTAWYRNCIEVRDTQGAERILLTAISKGASDEELADMMFTAVTDHFYLDGGHTLDFHNKAFESLRFVRPEKKAQVLASLVPLLGNPTRSEELHQWQAPINLVEPLRDAFRQLPAHLEEQPAYPSVTAEEEEKMVAVLLGDQPLTTIDALLEWMKDGKDPVQLARLVVLAAGERIVRFHTQNDFGDWIAVLHTFTYAQAVHETASRGRRPQPRAIFYGAISVYLDRFLNMPPAARPKPAPADQPPALDELLQLMDQRQQVNEAAAWVARYLHAGGDRQALMNTLGHALLREDAEFHTFQLYEAAMTAYDSWSDRNDPYAEQAKETLLLAATRYLAAHAPTARETPHTARIAWRLYRGEKLFEE
ncbi:Rieske 2Fe-2S domain-containing protein [Paenibacillus rhizovicinus]|uniref:Rieske 2Fe-2S domain-containing protein n=1 Tax=Paenibacillus rhizovicinus TaxID=2704463 RepID=A0A6C0NUH2_9BACL|nr:Rieske 2Fe-2S domain-containing protein [Paenibacillus rhizovicinus]QHW29827.1 Rieske 2Fe-2S domain-containing protein [Paenibacillus rhizovicinus]